MEWMARGAVLAVALLTVAGCGGGGGGGKGSLGGSSNGTSNGTYTAGVFQPSSSFANQCSSTVTQNMFLRSWTNELYLWYSEVPDRNPGSSSTADYFAALKTPAITASGRSKDQFHFTYSTAEWEQLSQAGVEVGYGAEWVLIASAPPRKVIVAYSEPSTPAGTANVPRGAEVLLADGVDVVNGSSTALNAAFFPDAAGETHTFRIRETSGAVRDISLTSVAVTHKPVLVSSTIDASGVPVGYLLFNDHIATAEAELRDAITSFQTAGVQDLILDLRYNGGGYLDIASELAYMIAGNRTVGQTFERSMFNDKYPNTNPVEGGALTPTPFHSTTVGIGTLPSGTPLPTLNLNRVYVITSKNTCSASEAIINSLNGIDFPVYQIGSTTCGKPYGFYPKSNCGTTYFSIQFEGRNAKGFATYPDGFTPVNSPDIGSVDLPGCSVADDFTHALGDTSEGRLQAALNFRASNNQSCPAATGFTPGSTFSSKTALSSTEGDMLKSPARTNRILRE